MRLSFDGDIGDVKFRIRGPKVLVALKGGGADSIDENVFQGCFFINVGDCKRLGPEAISILHRILAGWLGVSQDYGVHFGGDYLASKLLDEVYTISRDGQRTFFCPSASTKWMAVAAVVM